MLMDRLKKMCIASYDGTCEEKNLSMIIKLRVKYLITFLHISFVYYKISFILQTMVNTI